MSESINTGNVRSAQAVATLRSLAMPAQSLWHYAPTPRRRRLDRLDVDAGVRLAGVALAVLTLAATIIFACELYRALALNNGATPLHYVFLALLTLAFSWMAFGAANAIVGAWAIMFNRGGDTIDLAPIGTLLTSRTALLFPIYHEQPEQLAHTIENLAEEIIGSDLASQFDLFVLSDTRTRTACSVEDEAFAKLANQLAGTLTLTYRNRSVNTGKKAGNIADWIIARGGEFDHFIVFDADSVMTIETIARLVATMQESRGTALIQTVPRLTGASTRFALLQQFANNLYGPLAAAGMAAWQGASGNYWGHNAIIRTSAFAGAAGLPQLPGSAPFGGHIQSHDFVEAALLRRAGWRVALATSLEGSYEGGPPTIVEAALRDRRWMQGNLQHAMVVPARGFAGVSRVHLLLGIFAYVSSALWAAMLLCGLVLALQENDRVVSYFGTEKSLFPSWPTFDPHAGLSVLAGTMVVVFLPKLLGLAFALGQLMRGRQRVARSLLLIGAWFYEVIVGALLAPVYMVLHVKGLIEVLNGRDSGWMAQNRNGTNLTLAMAARVHWLQIAGGALYAGVTMLAAPKLLPWLIPILSGLILAPLLAWCTARAASPIEKWLLTSAN